LLLPELFTWNVYVAGTEEPQVKRKLEFELELTTKLKPSSASPEPSALLSAVVKPPGAEQLKSVRFAPFVAPVTTIVGVPVAVSPRIP
jgi:hypothetical protein